LNNYSYVIDKLIFRTVLLKDGKKKHHCGLAATVSVFDVV